MIVTPGSPEAAACWRLHACAQAEAETVEIPPRERARLWRLAEAIRTHKRAPASDQTWDGRGFTRRNYLGLCGAWAAGQVLELPVDERLYDGPDPGYDLGGPGCRVDVKTRQGWLTFRSLDAFRADWAVLVNPVRGTYRMTVVGGLTRAAFCDGAFQADFGYGVCWCVTGAALLSPRALRACFVSVLPLP